MTGHGAEVWCPFHLGYVIIGNAARNGSVSFAAHIQRCPGAPASVKAAYRRWAY